MDFLFPYPDRVRSEFKESATKIGFEELTVECTANVHLLQPHDRVSVLLMAWKKIGDYLTQNQYAPCVGNVVNWVGRYTLNLWFGRDWIACSAENKTSLIEHMMKVFPAAYITMHPYSWPYMFSIYRDPWTVEYLNINFQSMNGPEPMTEILEPKDSEYIKQEGISLIILRMINMFDFSMIKLVKHICLRVLLAWQDTTSTANSAMHATPNAVQYIDYVTHIYLIAICELNGPKDLHYVIECIQRNLHCIETETGSLERTAQTIAKGLQQSKTNLTEFLNTFLLQVPDRYFNTVFGIAVSKYITFLTEYQLRKLHSVSSIKSLVPYEEVYEKLVQMFIKQRESSEELMKTTAVMSETLFAGVHNLQALKITYDIIKLRTRFEWYTTKLTVLLAIISEEVNVLEDYKYNDDLLVDELLEKEQELATFYGDFAKLLSKIPYLEQEAWLTSFSLNPCREYMDQVIRCGSRNLRAIKKQAQKFKPVVLEPTNLKDPKEEQNITVNNGQNEENKSKLLPTIITLPELPSTKTGIEELPTTSAAFFASLVGVASTDIDTKDVNTVDVNIKEGDTKESDTKESDNKEVDIKEVDIKEVDIKEIDTKEKPIVQRKEESKNKPKTINKNTAPPKGNKRGPRPKGAVDQKPKAGRGRPTLQGKSTTKSPVKRKSSETITSAIKKPAADKADAKDKDSAEVIYAAAAGAAENISIQTAKSLQYPAFALINSVTDTEDLIKFTDYNLEIDQYEDLNRLISNLKLRKSNTDDILALLISPRYKRLTWSICWKTLKKRCRELLTKDKKKKQLVQQYMADANDRLTHLDIDYEKYKDKPQIDYGTIESGYECFDTESGEDTALKPVVADPNQLPKGKSSLKRPRPIKGKKSTSIRKVQKASTKAQKTRALSKRCAKSTGLRKGKMIIVLSQETILPNERSDNDLQSQLEGTSLSKPIRLNEPVYFVPVKLETATGLKFSTKLITSTQINSAMASLPKQGEHSVKSMPSCSQKSDVDSDNTLAGIDKTSGSRSSLSEDTLTSDSFEEHWKEKPVEIKSLTPCPIFVKEQPSVFQQPSCAPSTSPRQIQNAALSIQQNALSFTKPTQEVNMPAYTTQTIREPNMLPHTSSTQPNIQPSTLCTMSQQQFTKPNVSPFSLQQPLVKSSIASTSTYIPKGHAEDQPEDLTMPKVLHLRPPIKTALQNQPLNLTSKIDRTAHAFAKQQTLEQKFTDKEYSTEDDEKPGQYGLTVSIPMSNIAFRTTKDPNVPQVLLGDVQPSTIKMRNYENTSTEVNETLISDSLDPTNENVSLSDCSNVPSTSENTVVPWSLVLVKLPNMEIAPPKPSSSSSDPSVINDVSENEKISATKAFSTLIEPEVGLNSDATEASCSFITPNLSITTIVSKTDKVWCAVHAHSFLQSIGAREFLSMFTHRMYKIIPTFPLKKCEQLQKPCGKCKGCEMYTKYIKLRLSKRNTLRYAAPTLKKASLAIKKRASTVRGVTTSKTIDSNDATVKVVAQLSSHNEVQNFSAEDNTLQTVAKPKLSVVESKSTKSRDIEMQAISAQSSSCKKNQNLSAVQELGAKAITCTTMKVLPSVPEQFQEKRTDKLPSQKDKELNFAVIKNISATTVEVEAVESTDNKVTTVKTVDTPLATKGNTSEHSLTPTILPTLFQTGTGEDVYITNEKNKNLTNVPKAIKSSDIAVNDDLVVASLVEESKLSLTGDEGSTEGKKTPKEKRTVTESTDTALKTITVQTAAESLSAKENTLKRSTITTVLPFPLPDGTGKVSAAESAEKIPDVPEGHTISTVLDTELNTTPITITEATTIPQPVVVNVLSSEMTNPPIHESFKVSAFDGEVENISQYIMVNAKVCPSNTTKSATFTDDKLKDSAIDALKLQAVEPPRKIQKVVATTTETSDLTVKTIPIISSTMEVSTKSLPESSMDTVIETTSKSAVDADYPVGENVSHALPSSTAVSLFPTIEKISMVETVAAKATPKATTVSSEPTSGIPDVAENWNVLKTVATTPKASDLTVKLAPGHSPSVEESTASLITSTVLEMPIKSAECLVKENASHLLSPPTEVSAMEVSELTPKAITVSSKTVEAPGIIETITKDCKTSQVVASIAEASNLTVKVVPGGSRSVKESAMSLHESSRDTILETTTKSAVDADHPVKENKFHAPSPPTETLLFPTTESVLVVEAEPTFSSDSKVLDLTEDPLQSDKVIPLCDASDAKQTPKTTDSKLIDSAEDAPLSSDIQSDEIILQDDDKVFNNNLLDPHLKTYKNNKTIAKPAVKPQVTAMDNDEVFSITSTADDIDLEGQVSISNSKPSPPHILSEVLANIAPEVPININTKNETKNHSPTSHCTSIDLLPKQPLVVSDVPNVELPRSSFYSKELKVSIKDQAKSCPSVSSAQANETPVNPNESTSAETIYKLKIVKSAARKLSASDEAAILRYNCKDLSVRLSKLTIGQAELIRKPNVRLKRSAVIERYFKENVVPILDSDSSSHTDEKNQFKSLSLTVKQIKGPKAATN